MATSRYAYDPAKLVDREAIIEVSARIAETFHPDRIILFGSYAGGEPTTDSDVDLLVIMPCEGDTTRKAVEISLKTHPWFPLDLLVRTPETIRHRLEMEDWFIEDILEKGEVLYEAVHARVG